MKVFQQTLTLFIVDYILYVVKDVNVVPNPNEVKDYRYVTLDDLKKLDGKAFFLSFI
jgi:isopentenyldiphosphate isomerase